MGLLNKKRLRGLNETLAVAHFGERHTAELLTERLFSESPARRAKIIPAGITIDLEPAEFVELSAAKPSLNQPSPAYGSTEQGQLPPKEFAPRPVAEKLSVKLEPSSSVVAHERSDTHKYLSWLVLLVLSFAFAFGTYCQVKKAQHAQTALQRQELRTMAAPR